MNTLKINKFTGGFTATNGYAFEGPDGWVVVDAPEGMASWLKQSGISPSALLLTHMHFDHVMDAAAIVREYGATVSAFATPSRDLTLEELLGAFSGSGFEVEPFVVDAFLEDKTSLVSCGQEIGLIHVPGHSPDSLCFYLSEQTLLFGGDVLMQRGIGRSDFPHGDRSLLEHGIRDKLYPLPPEILVLPGHGPETTIGEERTENPFVRC